MVLAMRPADISAPSCKALCIDVSMGVERVCGELIGSEQPLGRGEALTPHHALRGLSVSEVLDRFVLKLRELSKRQRALAEIDHRPSPFLFRKPGQPTKRPHHACIRCSQPSAQRGQGRAALRIGVRITR